MKGNRLLALVAFGLIGASMPLNGQSRDGVRRAAGERAERSMRGASPAAAAEGALRLRDRLELTDAQVTALEGIRDRSRTAAEELRAEMQAVRDEIQGGDVTRNQIRERMTALSERQREMTGPLRQELDDVLTAEQEARLRQGAVRVRAAVAQRTQARMGRNGSPARVGARNQGTRAPRAGRAPRSGRVERQAPRGQRSAILDRQRGIARQGVVIRRGR